MDRLTRMLLMVSLCVAMLAPVDELLAAKPELTAARPIVQGNTKFALNLYGQLAKGNEGKNVFCSPYSISSALAMTAEGARGETALEMGTVLCFPIATRRKGGGASPWHTAKVHAQMGALNKRFNRPDKPYELRVANALWGEKTMPFRPQFVKALDGPYGAAMMPANFKGDADSERVRINDWVEQETNEKIKDLLPKGILDALTRLVLTNAIYFKGTWLQTFEKKSTRDMRFTLADGKHVQAPMMHHNPSSLMQARRKSPQTFQWPFGYAALDAAGKPTRGYRPAVQILEMPYTKRELSMFILLPSKPDGLAALEKQLTAAKLTEWLALAKPQAVRVWMPKFKIETEYELKPALSAMGMPAAFRPGGFTGLTDSAEAKDLYISAVRHKAFVEVNEEGTEAAAATAVVIKARSAGPRYPTFMANRPFVFLIRDNQTGSILFLGRMMIPAK